MKGIKFKMKDGTFDYYDPLEENNLQITEDIYILDMVYQHEIPKENVEYYEWYNVCNICGYELFEEECKECAERKELNDLRNGKHIL